MWTSRKEHEGPSHSFCYSTQLHRSHRIHPATHHTTRILYIYSSLQTHPKDCTSTRKKQTIYDLPQHQNNLYRNWFPTENPQTSTLHQPIGILLNQQFYKSRKSTDVKTFIFKNTSTSLPANTFYEKLHTYNNIHERRTEEYYSLLNQNNTHATQLNWIKTQCPHTTTQHGTSSHNNSPNHGKQWCHIPLHP